MAWLARLGLAWVWATGGIWAADPAPQEVHAYEVALRFFQGAAYDLAEKELASFLQAHPGSEKGTEAVLLLAQARYQQQKAEAALQVLQERLPAAGPLTDQYLYWIGECQFRLDRFAEAISAFSQVATNFPASTNRLDAVVGEAYAQYRTGNARRTVELLSATNSIFGQAIQGRPADDLVVRGLLLLGNAALACEAYAVGEAALTQPMLEGLKPEFEWQRRFLLSRLQVAGQRWDAARTTIEGLLGQSESQTNTVAIAFRADATALLGQVFEQTNNLEGALRAWEQNLAAGVPAARREQAAVSLSRLALTPGRGDATPGWLEGILNRYPGDAGLDPLRLALSDWLLRRHFAAPPAAGAAALTLIQQARRTAVLVTTNASPALAGKAFYNLGWCFWEESRVPSASNQWSAALEAFQSAARSLPRSLEQAIARFKAGDCQYALTNYAAALTNYWQAATNYVDLPGMTNAAAGLATYWKPAEAGAEATSSKAGLADSALHQVVRTGLELGDFATAESAISLLWSRYPDSPFTDRGMLLYGQALGRSGKTAEARAFLQEHGRRLPQSPWRPEAELTIALTWQQEGNWGVALADYDRWLTNYAEHPSRGVAEYERAWATFKTQDETNALQRFTNYVATFSSHPLAPAAQHWVADHYFRKEQFDLAELEYQKIFQNTNWASSELCHYARLMAGRSAFARRVFREAKAYLIDLINTNCPPDLLPEVYFLLGDSIRQAAESTNLVQSFSEAVEAYSRIPRNHPNSPLVPLAWGEIGNCHFQLGTADPKAYLLAATAYTNVLTSVPADVATRSQAEVGLGLVRERQAGLATAAERPGLLAEALTHYLNVTEGKNLREGEVADSFWVEKAATNAARLAEEQQRWEVAERLYQRLLELAPALKEKYEARLERLRQVRKEAETPKP